MDTGTDRVGTGLATVSEGFVDVPGRSEDGVMLWTDPRPADLPQHGKEGWQLKAITAADVKARVGPGGVDGLLLTFERHA